MKDALMLSSRQERPEGECDWPVGSHFRCRVTAGGYEYGELGKGAESLRPDRRSRTQSEKMFLERKSYPAIDLQVDQVN